jgi:hypothetical protein
MAAKAFSGSRTYDGVRLWDGATDMIDGEHCDAHTAARLICRVVLGQSAPRAIWQYVMEEIISGWGMFFLCPHSRVLDSIARAKELHRIGLSATTLTHSQRMCRYHDKV